jgi:hypothetical protein
MVDDLENIEPPNIVYEECLIGKHHQESFPKDKAMRASQPLVLVHSDMCGPMVTSSIGVAKSFLTFIDDFSCFLWIYTIKSKDEVFGKFQEFKPCGKSMQQGDQVS